MMMASSKAADENCAKLPVYVAEVWSPARVSHARVTFTPSLRGFPAAVLEAYRMLRENLAIRSVYKDDLTEAQFNYFATALLWKRIMQVSEKCDCGCSSDCRLFGYVRCQVPRPLAEFINSIGPFEYDGVRFDPKFPECPAKRIAGKLPGTLGVVIPGETAEIYQDVPVLGVALARCWAELQLAPGESNPMPNLSEFIPEGKNWETTVGLLGNGPIEAVPTSDWRKSFQDLSSFDEFGFHNELVMSFVSNSNFAFGAAASVPVGFIRFECLEYTKTLASGNIGNRLPGSVAQIVSTWQQEMQPPRPSSQLEILPSTAWPRVAAFRRRLSDNNLWFDAIRYCWNDYVVADSDGLNHGWCCVREKSTGNTPLEFNDSRNSRRNVPEEFVVKNVITAPARSPEELWFLRSQSFELWETSPLVLSCVVPTLQKTFTPSFRGFPALVSMACRALESHACTEAQLNYYATVILWARIVFVRFATRSTGTTLAERKFLEQFKSQHCGYQVKYHFLPPFLTRAINAIGPVEVDGIQWIPEFPPLPNTRLGQVPGTLGVIEPNGTAEVYQDLPTIGVALARCMAESRMKANASEHIPNLDMFIPEGKDWCTTENLLGNGPIRYSSYPDLILSPYSRACDGVKLELPDQFGYSCSLMSSVSYWDFPKSCFGYVNFESPNGSLSQLILTRASGGQQGQGNTTAFFRENVGEKTFFEAMLCRFNDILPSGDDEKPYAWCCVRSNAETRVSNHGTRDAGGVSEPLERIIPHGFMEPRNRRRNVPGDLFVERFCAMPTRDYSYYWYRQTRCYDHTQ